MKQIIFFFLLLAINTNFLLAQNNVWKELSQNELSADPQSIQRNYLPEKYKLFQTDHAALRQALQNAASTGVPIALPLPDGGMADFKVSNYSVMSPALASKFPDFNTYTIESIDATNPLNGRVGITPEGFHAVYLTDHGLAFVLPFAKRQLKFYMSYYDTDCKDFNGNTLQFTCGNTDNEDIHTPHNIGALETLHNNHSSVRTNSAALEEKRTYRMAMACTGEYANQNGGTVSSVINSFVLFTNTINLIYERDLSIKFELIDNEEALVFLNPNTDPYHDSNVGSLLIGQNTTIINQNVGAQNYDVGHVMTATCSDVGGIASPSVICTGNKGNGVTCQYTDLETIALRVACHEIGHQFSASHTWANCPGILDQLVSDSAFEPGSGTTIMSYAGFCGAQNTQDSQYAYFHARSLEQIIDFSRNGNGNVCPTVIETTNHIPTITLNYPSNMYIPISTPFELNASVSDEDNNSMKYTWEQYDLDPGVHDLGMPLGDAPTFKNFDLSNNTNRYFPRLSQIISNSSDNIEVLPTYSRNLTFRFVARDMVAQQGAVAWEEVKFKSTGLAGPFLVQNPNTGSESWTSGNFQQVTWDVANTNNAPVNCKKVRLRLSIDGGNTYPYTLLSETDNDGAEYVVVPSDIATTNARVRIEGVNNVFFDISNSNFDIVAPTTPTYSLDYFPREASFCLPNSAEIIFSSNSILGFTEPIHLEIVEGLPDQAQATFTNSTINPGQNATLNLNFPANVPGGEFILKVRATASGTDTTYREIKINTYSNDFSALTQQLPTDGAVGVNGLPTFQFNLSPNALTYDLQIATNPSFTSESIVHVKTNLTQNTYVPTVTLPINSTLYWRVRPINDCGEGSYLTPFAFHTESFTCTNYNAIG
ncbi:MAG: hypothetical protein KA010_03725, partial [Saprospiraceae bacterium]|nr:hypothetical protein [Saprospiraceae bacterium]